MKKILCPTDFTSVAENAVTYAAKLAQKGGYHLDLINVQSLAERTPEEALLGEQINAQLAYDRLEDFSREISRVFHISCNARVTTSVTALSTVLERESSGYELVVMGTHAGTRPTDYFLGSHSYRLAKHSSVPVMVVPEGCGYSDIQRAAFAYDYWRNDQLPHQQLVQVLKPLGTELTILDVLEKSVSLRAEEEMKGDQGMIRDSFGSELTIRFDTLHTDHIAEALDRYIKEKQIDLLILCTQHQSFIDRLLHKSVIKEMSRRATYPMLIIHT